MKWYFNVAIGFLILFGIAATGIHGDFAVRSTAPYIDLTDTTAGHDDWRVYADGDNIIFGAKVGDASTVTAMMTLTSSGSIFMGPASTSVDVLPALSSSHDLGNDNSQWRHLVFKGNLVAEGGTVDAYETTVHFINPAADITVTMGTNAGRIIVVDSTGCSAGEALIWDAAGYARCGTN